MCRSYVSPQMPLFTNVDDLMTSWERLKTDAGSEAKAPTIQVGAECRNVSFTTSSFISGLFSAMAFVAYEVRRPPSCCAPLSVGP